MKLTLILFSLIALNSCNNLDKNENHQSKLGGDYGIETILESGVSDYNLTIAFNPETNQVSGFSGCNRFFGSYTLENSILNLGPLASTKMMCQDSKNKIEAQLLDQLSNINSFSIQDKTLILKADNKTIVTAILN